MVACSRPPLTRHFLAVAVRAIFCGKPRPRVAPHVLAMVPTPADQESGPIGYQVAAKAKRMGLLYLASQLSGVGCCLPSDIRFCDVCLRDAEPSDHRPFLVVCS